MNRSDSRFECIDGFAEELDEIIYEGISNWFISFRSLFTIYSAHFSYLLVFVCITGCGILSFRHSIENGKKYTQYWWGAFVQGLMSERGYNAKYWHAQSPVMLFGKQLPLHILLLYPFTIYVCTMAVQRLQLSICTEPAAIGLLVMLMEVPFRMISVKFLHITYHDSEPLFYHKLCGVPWVEIFSSLAFASSYAAIYHGAKLYHTRDLSSIWDKSEPDPKEALITVACGLITPFAAFIQKIVFFHIFHDFLNINPISCLFFVVCLYMSFILCFEPKRGEKHVTEDSTAKTYLFWQITMYFACLLFLTMFGKPQNEISIGRHEPTGDCTTLVCSKFPLGKSRKRRKYLCADEIGARKNFVYNFECLQDGPPCLNAIWYTICGSPICNKPQFILNILSFTILISAIFAKTLFSEVKKIEVVKKLILRFHLPVRTRAEVREEQLSPEPDPEPEEEVTVGFVMIQDRHKIYADAESR